MATPIKYSTTGSESGAISVKNFRISTEFEGFGTSSTTGFYSGYDAGPDTKYTLYIYTGNSSNPFSIYAIPIAGTEEFLLDVIQKYEPGITTEDDALTYISERSDMMIYKTVQTGYKADGLVLNLDGSVLSYDRSGPTWSDISGQGNDGSISSAGFNTKGYFEFSGSSRVTVFNDTSIQVTGDQTLEFIVYPLDRSVRTNFYNKSYGGEGTITYEPSGILNYFWGTAGSNTQPYQGFGTIGGMVTLNKWYHLTLVRNITNNYIRWYINSVTNNSTTPSYEAAVASTSPILIGDGYTSNFVGRISRVRQYNVALTDDEVKTNYYGSNIVKDNLIVSLDPKNFVCYEKGMTMAFSLNNGNTASFFNGLNTDAQNNYWDFNGGSSQYMELSENPLVSGDLGSGDVPYTIEAWIYTSVNPPGTSVLAGQSIIGHSAAGGIGTQIYRANGTQYYFNFGARGNSNFNSTPLDLNKWYHCVGVHVNSSTNYIYINGNLNTSGSSLTITYATNPIQVGYANTRITDYYDGRIGYVAIYSKALSAGEVRRNYESLKNRFG